MNTYKLKVPGKLETAYPLFEEQQLDIWHCDGSGNTYVATYSFEGRVFTIYCSGEMDWRFTDPKTGSEQRWRSSSDISLPELTDEAVAKILDADDMWPDMNCWFEAEWSDDEGYGSEPFIDGSLDGVIAQCYDAISKALREKR